MCFWGSRVSELAVSLMGYTPRCNRLRVAERAGGLVLSRGRAAKEPHECKRSLSRATQFPQSVGLGEPSGTTSYAPVPLLVMMTEETGDPGYQRAAVRAAEYVWASWGRRGLFVGGASDNPNITDKEAGMLSMEAFLGLYDSTKAPQWLERAKAAADFTESWIWDLPMPVDADDSQLHWKKGISTVGVQGITAMASGGVDEYLDWAVPSYAKLYNCQLTATPSGEKR